MEAFALQSPPCAGAIADAGRLASPREKINNQIAKDPSRA
jgi:hypothetical protein